MSTFAQDKEAIQAHIEKGIKAIQDKDLTLWQSLFLRKNQAYDFFKVTNPEILIYQDPKLIEYKLESEFLKFQASVINLFIEQHRDYKQGSYINIDWNALQISEIEIQKEVFELGNESIARYYGWILLQHNITNKFYFGSFDNIIEFRGAIYGLDIVKEKEIQSIEFLKLVDQIKENGRIPEVSTHKNPTQSPTLAATETSEIFEGTIGNKKVAVYWSSLATDNGTFIIHDVRMVQGNEEEILFEVTTLDDAHFILTEEDAAGYYHIKKSSTNIEVTWYANDKKSSQKFNLKLKK